MVKTYIKFKNSAEGHIIPAGIHQYYQLNIKIEVKYDKVIRLGYVGYGYHSVWVPVWEEVYADD